jgi:hypothetical protein
MPTTSPARLQVSFVSRSPLPNQPPTIPRSLSTARGAGDTLEDALRVNQELLELGHSPLRPSPVRRPTSRSTRCQATSGGNAFADCRSRSIFSRSGGPRSRRRQARNRREPVTVLQAEAVCTVQVSLCIATSPHGFAVGHSWRMMCSSQVTPLARYKHFRPLSSTAICSPQALVGRAEVADGPCGKHRPLC